ncbi:MAG: metallophosphoesterase [Thermoleophilia bacterium]|nr:metallophosphoesterase [Thermoleophilia bacterium]
MSKLKVGVVACSIVIAGIVATVAQAAPGDTLGVSTLVQRILPSGDPGYNTLTTGVGEDYIVRDGTEEGGVALGTAGADRATKRTSVSYFGQLTDFQLADEESPARVEFLDSQGGPFTSAWRTAEALNPQEENAMIEQMNAFAANAPTANGDGSKPGMEFVVNTGDISDSQQYNETLWNRQLVEGDMVDPGSGETPPALGTNPLCPNSLTIADTGSPSSYTGVQDRDDWPAAIQQGYFYDPDDPTYTPPTATPLVPYADAPEYPGLMNRAQQAFQATGLDVPSYMVFGNHDGLVQGNAYASELFNEFATGCMKPVADAEDNGGESVTSLYALLLDPDLTQADFLQLYVDNPDLFMGVPPDPDRRLINKKQYMDIFKANGKDDGHGFDFVDAATATASNGSAGYYSWSPKPGVRYITLDTHSEGGKILVSDKGNLDTPQFNWYEDELQKATDNNEVVVTFSHHAVGSLSADVLDENAPQCADVDPTKVIGCDADPRSSAPIKLENAIRDMILKYPNMIAWVAGHSHVNDVTPYKNPNGEGGFWSIRTAALADWPKQNRLVQIFDNEDGNLSIFGTLIDEASPVPTPAPGTNAASFTTDQLASISREVGYNDSQSGGRACGDNPCGEGTAADRNVELLIKDPRRDEPNPPVLTAKISKVKISPKKKTLKAGKKTKLTVKVTNSGTAAKKNAKLFVKSSNERVKVRKKITIKSIGARKTVKIKITVRAKSRARGKAKITASVSGKKGSAILKIKAKKKR